jgi:hypothetical protein
VLAVLTELPPDHPFTPAVRATLELVVAVAALAAAGFTLGIIAFVVFLKNVARSQRREQETLELLGVVKAWVDVQKAAAATAESQSARIEQRVVGQVAVKAEEIKATVAAVPEKVVGILKHESADPNSGISLAKDHPAPGP